MNIANIIFGVVLFLPILAVLLYMAIKPENAALWGSRWRLKNEDLEPSEEAIKYTRITSIIMIVIGIFLLIVAISRS